MLSNLLNKGIGMVCHDGYQAGMYDAYTNYMVKQNYYPSYIIIPINLRSFSIGWDLGGPQFIDEMLYLDFYNTPLSPFLTFTTNLAIPDGNKLYENIYYLSTEFDGNTVVGSGGDYENKLKNASLNTRFKLMFQMNYLASVNADNSKLNNLLNIADRYRNTKTKVIFYITPIDYQTGEKYFGKRFLTQVKENANTIVSQLKQHQSLVLDLSTSLPSKNFIWKEESYVNEHMNKDGRAFIAAQLAKTIEGNK
jgi:hypothetical protein